MDDCGDPLIPGLYTALQLSPHAEAQCDGQEVRLHDQGVDGEDVERRRTGDHGISRAVGVSTALPGISSICPVQGIYSPLKLSILRSNLTCA